MRVRSEEEAKIDDLEKIAENQRASVIAVTFFWRCALQVFDRFHRRFTRRGTSDRNYFPLRILTSYADK
jgi:hypothetical protein